MNRFGGNMKVSLVNSYNILYRAFQDVDENKIIINDAAIKEQAITKMKAKKKVSYFKVLLGVESPTKEQLQDLKIYISKFTNNIKLGQFLFGEEFVLDAQQPEINYKTNFEHLNAQHKYFENWEDVKDLFKECYLACLYQSSVIEHSNNDEVSDRAYKMLALFYSAKKTSILADVEKCITLSSFGYQNPIHDVFQNSIPVYNKDFNLTGWRKLVGEIGIFAIQNIALAKQIESLPGAEKIFQVSKQEKRGQIEDLLMQIRYKRYNENKDIAELCQYYRVPEDVFNRILDLIQSGELQIKTEDNLPDIVIDIQAELNDVSKKGMYIVRLPAGDPRGLILGKIVDNCQSITGHSEKCVIDGMTRANNGFYVLVKMKKVVYDSPQDTSAPSPLLSSSSASASIGAPRKIKIDWKNFEKQGNQILGEGYLYYTTLENLTFDSWENKRKDVDDAIMGKVLHIFGRKVHEINPMISRLTIGNGGKTPKSCQISSTLYSEVMKEGYFYGDATHQSEIFVSQELENKRAELRALTNINEQRHIGSLSQADELLALPKARLNDLIKTNEYTCLTSLYFKGFYEELSGIMLNDHSRGKQLISDNALELYKSGEVKFVDLKNYTANKIAILSSDHAREVYKSGYVRFVDLKEFDQEKIAALVSPGAIHAYASKMVRFASIKDCTPDQIKILTSMDAIEAYGDGTVLIDDLKDLDASAAKVLVSIEARKIYKQEKLSSSDLKEFGVDKIKALMSHAAYIVYRSKRRTFRELKDCSALEINRQILQVIAEEICHELSTDYIQQLDEDKVEALLSTDAIMTYYKGYLRIEDLKDCSVIQIKLLTSEDASKLLATGKVSIDEVKEYSAEKIKALTSDWALEAYKNGSIDLSDVKDLRLDRIVLLLSDEIDFSMKVGSAISKHEYLMVYKLSRTLTASEGVMEGVLNDMLRVVETQRSAGNKVDLDNLLRSNMLDHSLDSLFQAHCSAARFPESGYSFDIQFYMKLSEYIKENAKVDISRQ